MRIARLVLAAGLLGACAERPSAAFDASRVDSAFAVALRSGATSVSLDSLGPREWTSMYVFGPYSYDKWMQKCMGTTSSIKKHGVDALDDRNLIVFKLPDGRVAAMPALFRAIPLADSAVDREYPRGSATFDIRDGPKWQPKQFAPHGNASKPCARQLVRDTTH